MTVNVQVAVQGGGAKLCLLLAALDALQRLEDGDGSPLCVTRLSGTSAGAIAAAIYAADISFERARQHFLAHKDDLLRHAKSPGWWDFQRAARGQPIASQDWLRATLTKLFQDRDGKPLTKFRHLKRPLFVVATDVTNGLPRIYHEPDEDLINALLNSAAIPFYFRGPAGKNASELIVDGGLCENLPVKPLRDTNRPDYGPVLGISFEPGLSKASPTTARELAMAIIDTMMDHSVARAQEELDPAHLLRLTPTVRTFEFGTALNEGLSEGLNGLYGRAFDSATTFFDGIATKLRQQAEEAERLRQEAEALKVARAVAAAERERQLRVAEERIAARPPEVVRESNRDAGAFEPTRQRMGEIFAALYEMDRHHYESVRMIVRVRAVVPLNDNTGRGEPDMFRYRLRFQAVGEPIRCLRVLVDQTPAMEFLETLQTNVYNRHGEDLQTIPVVAEDPKKLNRRGYLLFFKSPVRPGTDEGPYTLDYSHKVQGLMQDLVTDGVSHLEVGTNRAANVTPRVELIALLPAGVPGVTIEPSEQSTAAANGRPMTIEELRTAGVTWDPDEYPLAWLNENVPPSTVVAAKLRMP